MNNKLNLIFDFNNIAMRAMFTCAYGNMGSVSTFDTDEECNILIRKIATDMAYIARLFNPDRIIVACDAMSPWRKAIYDKIEDSEGYKGTRVKDESKNWDKIWKSLTEYKNVLKSKNFIVTELPSGEADDIAALWKEQCFIKGENVLLVSSDADWLQLVEFKNSNFCICFNPIANNKKHKNLYITDSFSNWLAEPNTVTASSIFFTNNTSIKETFKNIKSKDTKINYEIINPNDVVLSKIMCGDDGDNVPAIYQFYKNGKKVRMTPAKSKKILENLNIFNVPDLCMATSANALKPEIEKSMKKEMDDVDIDERLMRQRKLVELNPSLFPQDLLSSFDYHYKDMLNNGNGTVMTVDIKFSDILKDSKFLDVNFTKPKESAIFDNLKDLEKYIKPNNALF